MGEYNPKNPDAFNQVTLPDPKPPELNIVPVAGGSVVDTGQFSSPNFRKSRLGWRLDSQGNAEFSGGVFRGDFTIGGTVKTIARVADIQEALDEVFAGGGGKVYLQPGTYVLTADLIVPSGVALEGVSRDSTIIDGNGLYCVRIEGENPYTTGTISITNGTTTVTGTSTAFTQSMVGQYILLDGYWYEIATVTDADTLDTVDTFTGSTLSLDGYAIADPNFSTNITLLTITNAPNGGIICAYASEPKFNDLIITNCGTGLDLDYVYAPYIKVGCLGNGVGINMNYVDAFQVDFCDASDSTVGIGFVLTNSGNSTIFDSSFSGNVGDGVNMTGCSNIAFVSVSVNSNGGQGAEFVSSNSDIQFVCAEFADNTSDGVKLTATSDRISLSTSSIHDNGGYGINIAASTCDNNYIVAPAFSNNTSGNVSDSGTNTIIIDENLPVANQFGDGSDSDISITSGTTTLSQDTYCQSLTVSAGATLNTAGYILYARKLIDNAGTIRNNGSAGGVGGIGNGSTPGLGGSGGAGGAGATLAAGKTGGAGGDATLGNGNAGTNGTSANPSLGSNGANGGAGETAVGTGGAGGTGGTATSETVSISYGTSSATLTAGSEDQLTELIRTKGSSSGITLSCSAGAAGGGAGGNGPGRYGSGGGGGGGGGGIILLASPTIINTGTIQANGGNGGAGGADIDPGQGADGGGGGGGNGGNIFLIYRTLTNSGTIQATAGSGGAAGGSGATAGSAGSAGRIYKTWIRGAYIA